MSGKLIIITSDDDIKLRDYEDYQSIQEGVGGGLFERICTEFMLPVDPVLCHGASEICCDMYCNEEFFYRSDNEFQKANAVSMLITGQPHIRGNVVLIPSDPETGNNRGFEYFEEEVDGEIEEALCECWSAEDILLRYINNNQDKLNEIHKAKDKDRDIPGWTIMTLGER